MLVPAKERQSSRCGGLTIGMLTVGAVQVSNTKDVSRTALGSTAEAGADVSRLTGFHSGVGHGGGGESDDGEELHDAGFEVLDGLSEADYWWYGW